MVRTQSAETAKRAPTDAREPQDVFQCAMLLWEIGAGRSPQHPSAHTHLPSYALQQVPPAVFRVSGFSARANFAPDSPFRPDLRVLAWKPFGALLEEAWRPEAEERASAARLLQKLQSLSGKPGPKADPSPAAGSSDLVVAATTLPCAPCSVQ